MLLAPQNGSRFWRSSRFGTRTYTSQRLSAVSQRQMLITGRGEYNLPCVFTLDDEEDLDA